MSNSYYDDVGEDGLFSNVLRNSLFLTYLGSVFIGIPTACVVGSYNELKKSKLYEEALVVSDFDKDNIITQDDWKKAYQKAEILYDVLNPRNPKSLTISELEKIIESNK